MGDCDDAGSAGHRVEAVPGPNRRPET